MKTLKPATPKRTFSTKKPDTPPVLSQIEKDLAYIRRISDRISISRLAELIGYDKYHMHKVIHETPDAAGRVRKLPKKYHVALNKYVEDLQRE